MEKPTPAVKTFTKLKPMILRDLSSLHLNKRAPKYIGHINVSMARSIPSISDKLKKLKFVKKIRYDYRTYGGIVQNCRLKHCKTLTEQIYSYYKTLVSRKISKNQMTLETCYFSLSDESLYSYKSFFTKNYVQNVSFDMKNWNLSNKQSNYIISGVRRLTRHKRLKRINMVFRRLYANGNIIKFVHNLLLSVTPEVKVELILTSPVTSEIDIPSVITLQSLTEIAQKFVYFHLNCKVDTAADSKTLIEFVASLRKLVTLKLNIEGNREVMNSLVDTCHLIFQNNLALETLSLTIKDTCREWEDIPSKIKKFKFGTTLINYRKFFSALKIIEIFLPSCIISFQDLDESERNLFPHAQRIALSGLIATWEGFKDFVQGVKPYQFKGSILSLELQPYKLTDANPLFKALSTEIKVENLSISRLDCDLPVHIDCNIFLGFLNRIKGPKALSMEVSGSNVVLKDLDQNSIVEAWENLKERMRLPRFYIFCPKDNTRIVFDRMTFDELRRSGEISPKREDFNPCNVTCNLF